MVYPDYKHLALERDRNEIVNISSDDTSSVTQQSILGIRKKKKREKKEKRRGGSVKWPDSCFDCTLTIWHTRGDAVATPANGYFDREAGEGEPRLPFSGL